MNVNMSIAVQTIKDSVSALDVANALGWEVRHGRCRCPLHGGKDYNMKLYPGNRGYVCWVCKSGGDVIRLVQLSLFASENHTEGFKHSVSWLNDSFRLGLNLYGQIDEEQRRQAEMAQRMRKNAIEFQEWKDRMQLDLALAVDLIVEKLEERRDMHAPKTPDEAWDPLFCEAIRVLPVARKFAEKCFAECLKKNET